MSYSQRYAQRLTKSFNVVGASGATVGFAKSAIESVAASASVALLGNSYIVSGTVATTIPNSTVALPADGSCLKDMGKTVRFGSPTESCLFEFRLVQAPGTAANDGKTGDPANTFYVLTNNMTTTLTTGGVSNNLKVYVARA